MRLADFILRNMEPILVEWEAFARDLWPNPHRDPAELRDHAADILRATVADMASAQTDAQQSDKSKGDGDAGRASDRVDDASDVHAVARVQSGFDLLAVIAEYRALRASVIRLWRNSAPDPDYSDLLDLTRFNESIDQSLTEAVRSFTHQVDRSRQMFLAILGHDLRNPLNAVQMSAHVLQRTASLDADSAKMATHIASSANAMSQMISDLLVFTGSGLGSAMPISPKLMDVKALTQEVVEEMHQASPLRVMRFEATGDAAGGFTGSWDRARLRQVVSNLLGNAVQHGDDTSPVDVVLHADDDSVRLTVHNGGSPIPEHMIGAIFNPLVRGSSPELQKQRRAGSIGLGLFIAREVVIAHGGTIGVTSTADAGTTFTVDLPRHAAVPVPAV